MEIEKLPSGKYRIRMRENGQRYSMTVPYKPTQKQAYELLREKIDHPTGKYDTLTFEAAANSYIDTKNGVLSPSTIRGYKAILKNMDKSFTSLHLNEIDQVTLQKFVNDYAKEHSPKSCRNVHGFVSAVFSMFCPSIVFHTTMPQKVRVRGEYTPTEDEVRRLLEHAKEHNKKHWIILSLACLSLRRSEISGLSIEDLDDDNTLHIHKSLVENSDGKFVIKETNKTDTSTRDIIIPSELADAIREQGYITNMMPNATDQWMRRHLPQLGIPQFGIHRLRHFFASYAHNSGEFTDAQIQAIGGWKTDHVFKEIYRHAMDVDESKRKIANKFSGII